ncbi:MAG: GGDEF domain-containing protein [Rhodocyclales bacterium]|nr:GGDEF domain-containing protein [Rhodocyclales bacterium]
MTLELRAAARRLALVLLVACPLQPPATAATPDLPATVVLDPTLARIDLAGKVSVLTDRERRLSIDAVRDGPARDGFALPSPASGELNFGYSDAIYWLRIDVAAPAAQANTAPHARWLLEVAFPTLDRVALYVGDALEPIVAGDRQPFSARPYPHRNLVFPLALAAGQHTTLWLQVRSAGTLTVPLTLWRDDAFAKHNQWSYTVLALYYGAIVTLLLYNLLLYYAIRERSYLEYALCTVGMIIGQLALNGFGNQFVWPGATWWGHVALPFGMAMSGMFGALFTCSFLGTRKAAPRLDALLTATALAFCLTAIATLTVPYRYGATAAALLGPAFAGVALVCALHCVSLRRPQARIYLVAWAAVLLGAAVTGLRALGWLPTNAYTLHALQVGSMTELLLLSFALAHRINTTRRAHSRARTRALSAKKRLIRAFTRSQRLLEQQVAERTRELAQVNQILTEKERHLQHLASHDPLTGLTSRLLLDDRIQHSLRRARRQNQGIGVLLVDLDGFKPINDRHGHAAGDQVLIEVARRIRACVRNEDTVARYGGDEFVVVLEDVFDIDDIQRVAQSINNAFDHPFEVPDASVSMRASVGVAAYPRDGDTPATLLKAADKNMYGIKKLKLVQHALGQDTAQPLQAR